MDNIEQTADSNTTKKYITLLRMISQMEKRLGWTEIVYLSMNMVLFLFAGSYMLYLTNHKSSFDIILIEPSMILFCLVLGMALCVNWVAFAMRLQLKLKIRYFQARSLERKLNCIGECICSNESDFFDPEIRQLVSFDEKETIKYPSSGLLRMDGFIGSAKPRHLSWFMPGLFFVIYWITFIWIILKLFIEI